jgi:cytidine deaminase
MKELKFAKKFAVMSPSEHYRHGAIVMRKGHFITGAFNMPFKTHPNGSGPYSSCHAEIRAITKARAILNRNDLGDCTIYVMRLNKRGEVRLSKPCHHCMLVINQHNLKASWSTGLENVNVHASGEMSRS